MIWTSNERQGSGRSGPSRTKAVSSRLYGDVATADEACPATALGITLHSNIVRWRAWSMVRGSSVFIDRLGIVGNKLTSESALKNIAEVEPETRNEGCRPSHGATTEHDENEVAHAPQCDAPAMASPPWTITSVATISRTRLRCSGFSLSSSLPLDILETCLS